MEKIKVMANGIPGNMAVIFARHAMNDKRFEVIHHSLTGQEIADNTYSIGTSAIRLIKPDSRDAAIRDIIKKEGYFICVDYTHPSAVISNVEFYCKNKIPFVMGTTGGDRKLLEDMMINSSVPAVISPNMSKQIVGFQAIMEYAAKTFPGIFEGFSLEVKESHQKGKADTSGTAKAIVKYFNMMGIKFSESDIKKERDPEVQKNIWGIPEDYLSGHGWHTYTLVSNDKSVKFEFTHNVNGRNVYAQGTLDALIFLDQKVKQGKCGMFSMIDVLCGK